MSDILDDGKIAAYRSRLRKSMDEAFGKGIHISQSSWIDYRSNCACALGALLLQEEFDFSIDKAGDFADEHVGEEIPDNEHLVFSEDTDVYTHYAADLLDLAVGDIEAITNGFDDYNKHYLESVRSADLWRLGRELFLYADQKGYLFTNDN